jgi:hypothetical protein
MFSALYATNLEMAAIYSRGCSSFEPDADLLDELRKIGQSECSGTAQLACVDRWQKGISRDKKGWKNHRTAQLMSGLWSDFSAVSISKCVLVVQLRV